MRLYAKASNALQGYPHHLSQVLDYDFGGNIGQKKNPCQRWKKHTFEQA
jgi:hypothetical protein